MNKDDNSKKLENPLERTKLKVLAKLRDTHVPSHPNIVWASANDELSKPSLRKGAEISGNSAIYKALTINEFQEGLLMNFGFPEEFHSLSIDLSIKFQEEYQCIKPSEKATAHLAAHSYCRILNLQGRINRYLERGEITIIGDKYLEFLSKDLDRAQRHYFNAIQTLKMMRQPSINITVKTKQANFAHNMVAQQGKV